MEPKELEVIRGKRLTEDDLILLIIVIIGTTIIIVIISILDLGCGDGMVGSALRDRGFSSLHGMDLSPGMLAKYSRSS